MNILGSWRVRPAVGLAMGLCLAAGPAFVSGAAVPTTLPADDRLPPMLVTLHVKDVPVRQAYAELFQQVGVPLGSMPDELLARETGTVTEDADHRPFWDVFREMQRQTGLELTDFGKGPMVVAGSKAPLHGPEYIDGPLLFVATAIRYDVSLEPDPKRGTGSQMLQLKIAQFDGPGFDVLQQSGDVKVVEAVDELGNSLLPIKTSPIRETMTGPASGRGLIAILHVPDKKIGARLAQFRATVRMTVQIFDKPMEVGNLPAAPASSTTIGNNTFTFIACAKAGEQYSITLEVEQKKLADPHSGPLLRTHALVFDAQGHELAYTLGCPSEEGPGTLRTMMTLLVPVGVAADGTNAGPPAKLVWQIPSGVKHIDAPIEFHDLKLDLFGKP